MSNQISWNMVGPWSILRLGCSFTFAFGGWVCQVTQESQWRKLQAIVIQYGLDFFFKNTHTAFFVNVTKRQISKPNSFAQIEFRLTKDVPSSSEKKTSLFVSMQVPSSCFCMKLQLLFKKAKNTPDLFDNYKSPTSNCLFEEFGVNFRNYVSFKIAL